MVVDREGLYQTTTDYDVSVNTSKCLQEIVSVTVTVNALGC